MNYSVPAKTIRIELKVKNSRFIATAAYTPTVEEAKVFVVKIKKEFSDASHNVPAYIVGHGGSVIEHCNDDGEPGGTAGRPMLAVLKGSGFGDISVVVTRYFGGSKLGTGGLVQAYGAAVKEVLSAAPKAKKVTLTTVQLRLPYPHFESVKLAIQASNGMIESEAFAADVTIVADFDSESIQTFRQMLTERWPTSVSVSDLGDRTGLLPE